MVEKLGGIQISRKYWYSIEIDFSANTNFN